MITALWRELQEQGFTGRDISVWTSVAHLAPSSRDDSDLFFVLCACLDSPGGTFHPNSEAR